MTIYFYGTRDRYGCFSNFSPHGFELDGVYWPTSEHYFQAQKFAGTPHVDQIRQVKTARDAAKMGRDALTRRFANANALCVQMGNKSKTTLCGKPFYVNLKPMPTSAKSYLPLTMNQLLKILLSIIIGAVEKTAVAKISWG